MSSRKRIAGFVAVAALAGSLYGATFSSAAGTRVESRVVRTLNCQTNQVDVNAGVQIAVSAKKVSISTGDPNSPEAFLSFSTTAPGFTLASRCHSVARHVVMSRNRLTASHASLIECSSPAHVWIRLVLELDSYDYPLSAKIEVTQPHARLKPLAQVQWSPQQSVLYYGIACSVPK